MLSGAGLSVVSGEFELVTLNLGFRGSAVNTELVTFH